MQNNSPNFVSLITREYQISHNSTLFLNTVFSSTKKIEFQIIFYYLSRSLFGASLKNCIFDALWNADGIFFHSSNPLREFLDFSWISNLLISKWGLILSVIEIELKRCDQGRDIFLQIILYTLFSFHCLHHHLQNYLPNLWKFSFSNDNSRDEQEPFRRRLACKKSVKKCI